MTWNPFEKNSDKSKHLENRGLLGAGWRPLERNLDWDYLRHLLVKDTWELSQKSLCLISNFADALGRNDYAWWANFFNLFSENTRYEFQEFWNYVTPEPLVPDRNHKDILCVETPVEQQVSRQSIPIEHLLNRLQEVTLFKILNLLGRPTLITQQYLDRYFYYPVERFASWERLDVAGTVYAYWCDRDVWLAIYPYERNRRRYTLIAKQLAPLVHKATHNLAVMLSGYQSRIGMVSSPHPIASFPEDVRAFAETVRQAIYSQHQLAVLVHGKPGTGKTAWTQAIAQEFLVGLGYVIFILDHDAIENFVPPTYLEKICLIVNEADNLAQDRASAAARQNNRTEHILSLLDGTLYQSVVDDREIYAQQRLVVLMTCNTTERLDPALLRKGRVDLLYEFAHQFV